MTGVADISDYQLYALFHNKHIGGDLRLALSAEYRRRNFHIQYEEELRSRLKSVVQPFPPESLKPGVKALIILMPFWVPIHAIIANLCFLTKGNYTALNEYWRYITIGYTLWLGVILLSAHFLI
jgi:hypothetical protein